MAVLAAPPPPGPSYDYPPPDYDEPTGAPMDNMNALDVREEGFMQSNNKYQYTVDGFLCYMVAHFAASSFTALVGRFQ